jgi:hypothetical protein
MNKVIEWFTSWYHTLKVRWEHPELYRYLCDILDDDSFWDADDFVEVQRPNFRTWEQYKAENPDFPSFQSKDGEDL